MERKTEIKRSKKDADDTKLMLREKYLGNYERQFLRKSILRGRFGQKLSRKEKSDLR